MILSLFKQNKTKQKLPPEGRKRPACAMPHLLSHCPSLPPQGSDSAAIALHLHPGRSFSSPSPIPGLQHGVSPDNTLKSPAFTQTHSRQGLEEETHKPGRPHLSCPGMLCITTLLLMSHVLSSSGLGIHWAPEAVACMNSPSLIANGRVFKSTQMANVPKES